MSTRQILNQLYEKEFETDKGKFDFIRLENMKQTIKVSEPHTQYGLVKSMNEELWSEVVDFYEAYSSKIHPKYFSGYLDYSIDLPFPTENMLFKTALQSGQSLMKSLGITEGDWILIGYEY